MVAVPMLFIEDVASKWMTWSFGLCNPWYMIFDMIVPKPLVEGVCYRCIDCGCIPHSQYSSALVKCGFFMVSICCKKSYGGAQLYLYVDGGRVFRMKSIYWTQYIFQILLEHHYCWLLVFLLSFELTLQTSNTNLHKVILSDSQKSSK